jgi:outer membrane protein assembly factor BamD
MTRRWLDRARQVAVVALLLVAAGCGGNSNRVPAGTLDPDRLLYERGVAALTEKKWITAREYFRQIVEGYPQSTYRGDAKLGVGDTYLGEGGSANAVLAINEFHEFLTFYPTHARADYAQYRLAMAHFYQMAKPERDQTETREAIREFDVFFERYPNSAMLGEAREHYRAARDRLSESEYRVGLFYYRAKWYIGAVDRFKVLLKNDPQYTRRDSVYYYLAESLRAQAGNQEGQQAKLSEALTYYERLVEEFEQSEFLEDSRQRIAELKAAADRPSP